MSSHSDLDVVLIYAWQSYSLSNLANECIFFVVSSILGVFNEFLIDKRCLGYGFICLLNADMEQDSTLPLRSVFWVLIHEPLSLRVALV